MSDQQRPADEQPAAGTPNALVILLRIAIMFGIVPLGIMFAAKYLF